MFAPRSNRIETITTFTCTGCIVQNAAATTVSGLGLIASTGDTGSECKVVCGTNGDEFQVELVGKICVVVRVTPDAHLHTNYELSAH